MSDEFVLAQKYLAGGVNSPVRAFKGLAIDPVFIERGEGKYLFDINGKRYLDFCLSWGALMLGHAHPAVTEAVCAVVKKGTSFGAPTKQETKLAQLLCECVPSVERVRCVSSGTEAVMTAIRLARAFTGRNKILKFDGCYHGHSDCLLVSAGSGVAGLSQASSAGIPDGVFAQTLSIPFNDLPHLEKTLHEHGNDLAAVIIEPVPANMGLVLPHGGYLKAVRDLTTRRNILLVFDEVITGFRLGLGGAQERFGVTPDLTCLGKIIGGGFPVGAVGGRQDIMKLLAPEGPVYQAGTLSGNPVAMTAGITTVEWLRNNQKCYSDMELIVSDFAARWRGSSRFSIAHIGSMFTIFTCNHQVCNFKDAQDQSSSEFTTAFKRWLDNGIYLPPSRFETAFVSPFHTKEDMDSLLPQG
jgi:glutamate-1-semialdehyde 2,1-aminomutase